MATNIGWQCVLDVDKYPLVWKDMRERPVTFGEVMDVVFAGKTAAAGGGVSGVLGRTVLSDESKPSFILSDANIARKNHS